MRLHSETPEDETVGGAVSKVVINQEDRDTLQQAHRQLQHAHSAYMHADADLHDAAATELSAATLHFDAVYMRVYGVSAADLRRRRAELLTRGFRNHFPVA